MKEKLFELHNQILNCECRCGARKYIEGNCLYCNTENIEFTNLSNEFEKTLRWCVIDEDILLWLNNINRVGERKYFSDILNRYNYDEFLNKKLDELNAKIQNNNISTEDIKYIIYFMNNKSFSPKNINYISNLIMKKLLHKEIQLDKFSELDFVKIFTESTMKNIHPDVKNPECVFVELENFMGDSCFNRIRFDIKDIKELLDSKNYVFLLKIIFHECTHTNQAYRNLNSDTPGFYSYMTLLSVKENILGTKMDGYYKENYMKFSDEAEARYCEDMLLNMYLSYCGLQLDAKSQQHSNESMQKEQLLLNDETRKSNGKTTTIDELFESITLDYKLFENSPALKLQYKFIDEKLVLKTEEELLEDYEKLKQSEMYKEEYKAVIDFLYEKLLQKVKVQERGSYGS